MTSVAPAAPLGGRRAWTIWAVALGVYVLAVFHRTSLSVAGLTAARRFGISAGELATFTVVQLAVYAAMQIPVGVMLDRIGSRRVMLAGVTLMSAGQAWFALATTFGSGLGARILIGAGDSMIFTSALRLVMLWFRSRQVPVVGQLVGVLGQLGAIVAATPLASALRVWGWTPSFLVAASLGVAAGAALVAVVRDDPAGRATVATDDWATIRRTLAVVWRNPGTRLGLWSHFTAQFTTTVFAMLWGYPFLVEAQHVHSSTASALVMLMTFVGMVTGPMLGQMSGAHPFRRSQIVLAIVALIAAVWTVVLAWPGRAPLWVLVVLVVVTGLGGPASMYGFDLARSFHTPARLGRASGVVNIGGFVASLTMIGLIGFVLDATTPAGATRGLGEFRVAMSLQFVFWAFGSVQIVRYRRRCLAVIEAHPGALAALRAGDSLLPGLSRPADERDALGAPGAAPGDQTASSHHER